jgi:hypothetical protein
VETLLETPTNFSNLKRGSFHRHKVKEYVKDKGVVLLNFPEINITDVLGVPKHQGELTVLTLCKGIYKKH